MEYENCPKDLLHSQRESRTVVAAKKNESIVGYSRRKVQLFVQFLQRVVVSLFVHIMYRKEESFGVAQ